MKGIVHHPKIGPSGLKFCESYVSNQRQTKNKPWGLFLIISEGKEEVETGERKKITIYYRKKERKKYTDKESKKKIVG